MVVPARCVLETPETMRTLSPKQRPPRQMRNIAGDANASIVANLNAQYWTTANEYHFAAGCS